MGDMNPFDVFALVVVGLAALRTAFGGFVREASTLAWLVVGTTAGFLLSGVVGTWFEPWLGKGPLTQVAGFTAIFLLVFIITKMAESSLVSLLENLELDGLDHGLGFVLGVVEGLVLVFAVYFILDFQTIWDVHERLGASVSARFLSPFLPYATNLVAPVTGGGS